MKKKVIYFMSLLLALTACQSEDILTVDKQVPDGSREANVNFTLTLPEDVELQASRAALYGEKSSSAAGGLTNVNLATEHDLRYQLAIYRIDPSGNMIEAVAPIKKVVDTYQPVSFSLRLTPNRTYKAVVWADFVAQGTDTDLHYNTSDFKNITYADATKTDILNQESRDAYFISQEFTLNTGEITENLVLKRPFAKVRVVTTDWGLYDLEKADHFKVTYYGCKRFTGMNAITGTTVSEDLPTPGAVSYTGHINKDTKEYALNYDLSEHNRTLTVDYLMTDLSEQTPIHMTFEALDGNKPISKHDLKTNIPIQRNWLTTIMGNVLTADASFTITIDENFVNNWNVSERWWNPTTLNPTAPSYDDATKTYTIQTRDEFAWLPDNVAAINGKTVVLANDIDMSGVEWKPIHNASFNFDGQGHKLRNFSLNGKHSTLYEYSALGGFISYKVMAYTGVFGIFNGHISNVTFENITINGRADDAVHTDEHGNPIKHDNEPAYFAGCIAYTGRVWGTNDSFVNVHAKHVDIKASMSKGYTQNIGGLFGWIGRGKVVVENCSVQDIYLVAKGSFFDGEVGGLIGEIQGGYDVQVRNCTSDKVTIRKIGASRSRNAFIGKIKYGSGIVLDKNPVPTNFQYINHKTGLPALDYTPQNVYYGTVEQDENKIVINNP
ncbi:DUF6562 domain-containing protein [Porphyromonas crevioricanis]|nr:DUF6562 domain-containing protein [Porphyromonas crevioricanis]